MNQTNQNNDHKIAREPFADESLRSLVNTLRVTAENISVGEGQSASALPDLISRIGELLDVVIAINSNPVEDTDFCFGAVSKLLELTVTKTARNLKTFCENNYCTLKFESTAGAFTGALLSEHMKGLRSGDNYHVVSDVASWRDDQLNTFQKESETAVNNNVSIRRVFNLLLPEAKYSHLEQQDRRRILERHLEDSNSWNSLGRGEYKVRVFDDAQFDELVRQTPSLRFREAEIKGTHFGIFSRGLTDQTVVEYEVREHDLSVIYLWKNPEDIQTHRQIFDAIWEISWPLTIKAIAQITSE